MSDILFESLHKYNIQNNKQSYMLVDYLQDGYICKTKNLDDINSYSDVDCNYRKDTNGIKFDTGIFCENNFINGELSISDEYTLTDVIYKLIGCTVQTDSGGTATLKYVICDDKYPTLYGYLSDGTYIVLYTQSPSIYCKLRVKLDTLADSHIIELGNFIGGWLNLDLKKLTITNLNEFLISAFNDADAISDIYCWAYMPRIMLNGLTFAKNLCEEEFNMENKASILDNLEHHRIKYGKELSIEYLMKSPNLINSLDTITDLNEVDQEAFYNNIFIRGMKYVKYTDNKMEYDSFLQAEDFLLNEFSRRCLIYFKCRIIVSDIVFKQYSDANNGLSDGVYTAKNNKIILKIKEC